MLGMLQGKSSHRNIQYHRPKRDLTWRNPMKKKVTTTETKVL